MLKCPRCKPSMELVRFEPVEVNRCTACKGIWFDASEAEAPRRLRGSESIDVGDPEVV